MKQVTRRKRRKQAQAKRWAEIVGLARAGVPKAEIARRVHCCRQTVYNVLAKTVGLPETEAPVPRQPGPAPGTGRRVPALRRRVCRWRERWGRGARYCQAKLNLGLSPTTIERIWRQAGLLAAPAKRERPKTRWIPPRPQAPGHLQADVKYLPGGRFEYTAIDVCTKATWAHIYERLDSATAADFMSDVLLQTPFPVHTIQTDNGSEFALDFAQFLDKRQINHRRNAPRCAWMNGVVERFHRTVAEECYLALPGNLRDLSTAYLNRALGKWLAFYNNHRLHSGLAYKPPAHALLSFLHRVSN